MEAFIVFYFCVGGMCAKIRSCKNLNVTNEGVKYVLNDENSMCQILATGNHCGKNFYFTVHRKMSLSNWLCHAQTMYLGKQERDRHFFTYWWGLLHGQVFLVHTLLFEVPDDHHLRVPNQQLWAGARYINIFCCVMESSLDHFLTFVGSKGCIAKSTTSPISALILIKGSKLW